MAAAEIDIKRRAEKGHYVENSDVNAETTVSENGETQEVKHNISKDEKHSEKCVMKNDVIKLSGLCEILSNGKSGQKAREFMDVLMRLGGAKLGVKYKIEVNSPLDADGTYWACHVTSGYIQDKLQPLSDLLRSVAMTDSNSKAENFNEMVCARSTENKLWMRAVVIKEIDNQTVKLRFVDVGRSEDFQKDKVYKVPESLKVIPYLAFHCALFEESMNITYENRWRFSDLCKKKVVNFTCEKVIERENNKLLVGKLETIVDTPKINVAEEVKNFINES